MRGGRSDTENEVGMRVVLVTSGKFHTFHLGRELARHDALVRIFTGYPKRKLLDYPELMPVTTSRPFSTLARAGLQRLGVLDEADAACWHRRVVRDIDHYAAGHLPLCDVLVAMSASGLESGQRAQEMGASVICDRGSCDIRTQDQLLREEYARCDLEFAGIDPEVIDVEVAEYAQADAITIPSAFAARTFREQGVPAEKLNVFPYGVDLSRFQPTSEPNPDEFRIVFVGQVGVQKGVRYLFEAFRQFSHPRKRLDLIGSQEEAFMPLAKSITAGQNVHFHGHVPQAELPNWLSQADVFVLPSIQDGFGMVLTQALACGCPVIASENSGGPDVITDGDVGWVVPIRDPEAILAALETLAEQPNFRRELRQRAIEKSRTFGGWTQFGEAHLQLYHRLRGGSP